MVEDTNESKENKCPVSLMYNEYEHFEDDTLTPTQLTVLTIVAITGIVIISFSMYGFLNLK